MAQQIEVKDIIPPEIKKVLDRIVISSASVIKGCEEVEAAIEELKVTK